MLEPTVHNGPQELRLQQEVPEPRAVDGHVGTLHLLLASRGDALRCSLRLIILFVVQQLVIGVILGHSEDKQRERESTQAQFTHIIGQQDSETKPPRAHKFNTLFSMRPKRIPVSS